MLSSTQGVFDKLVLPVETSTREVDGGAHKELESKISIGDLDFYYGVLVHRLSWAALSLRSVALEGQR